ncbi:MAG TPA: site-specific integrase [Streptosporangiaceae bacterium]|jgi:integrase|nr:site-specific integrase [Streptosporangiaceae bacterium]
MDTSEGRVLVRRYGPPRQADADAEGRRAAELIALGDDPVMRAKIGDLIVSSTLRGGRVPDVATVARKIGARLDPDSPDVTVGEYFPGWLESKGKLKLSARRSYEGHGTNFLIPLLGEIPLIRLGPEHIAGMFTTIRKWNRSIEAQRAEGRAWIHVDGDVRQIPQVVGEATMQRIYATLRAMLNAAVRQRLIPWNPCAGVELPTVPRPDAQVWGPEQAAEFLEATAGHRLHIAWRLILGRGVRRGELGLQWDDINLDAGYLRIRRTMLELGGKVIVDTPKSRASARDVSLDAETVRLLREHRKAQLAERLAAGSAYEPGPGGGWVICDEIGRPYRPDLISARFRQAARAAGLPVIKLHEGRHTAATLALEAGVDVKVVSAQLGHSTTAITADIYQHVRRARADDAAEKVAALLLPRKPA